jgi:hypothetical protein
MTGHRHAFGYVIVQHSGCGYAGNLGFQHGLEPRILNTRQEYELVRRVGGLIFDSWEDAEAFVDREQYPPGLQGVYPLAPGGFSGTEIDGLRIYLPPAERMQAHG